MAETKKTLEMTRGGEFNIHTYGNNHCGVDEEFKIRYHLKCRCSPKLDRRGFLFDQLNVQSFFESIKKTKLSCEQLTVQCLEQLLEHILAENPGCQIYGMELTLSPAPFMASMTHAWENPNNPLKKPTAPKKSSSKRPAIKSVIRTTITDGSTPPVITEEVHNHEPSHPHYLFHEE